MEIDNFDIVRKHLDFIDTKLDRYVVHILRRPKDISPEMKNTLGANESQRLIKTYYVDSLEYLDRKREAIKELCRANCARAYIIVQPKDNFECLLNLGEKIFETIRNKNYSVKPEHLIRQAYCEWHKTRKKQWILDLDDREMFGWTVEQVEELVKKHLIVVGKSPDEMWKVQTKHGCHIITSPFNLMEAQKECAMLFEGVKNGNDIQDLVDQLSLTSSKKDAISKFNKHTFNPFNIATSESLFLYFGSDNKYIVNRLFDMQKKITGWLHKDGMTLLYADI